jgi:transcriptional regulator with XRE-family HTH domain
MLELKAMPLGVHLKDLRKAAALSQQALAIKAGLSIGVVARIEQGSNEEPKLATLRALAKALEITLDELVGEEEEPKPAPKKKGKGK